MKKIFCDICKKEVHYETDNQFYTEIGDEIFRGKFLYRSKEMLSQDTEEIMLCDDCKDLAKKAIERAWKKVKL